VTTAGLNYEGNHAAQYDGYVGGGGGDIWTEAFPVKPKERWKLDAYSIVWGTPDPDQSVGGTLITIAPQDFDTFRASDPTPYLYISEAGLDQNDLLNAWKHFEHEFEIGEDVATMWLDLHFYGIEDPALIQVWDAITLTRIKGNRCALESPVFAVTPKRSYSGTVTAEMPVTLIDGTLRVIARYSAEGRADVLEDLASLDAAPGETKILNYTVRPPSGYDECVIILAGEDVEGDSFTNVTVSDLVDTDDSSRVVEVKSPETQSSYVALPLTVAIPDGIEEMRLQVVAESQSAGWQVDDVSVVRSDGAPSTVAAVATALLSDAETSLALLLPGTIEGPEVLSYDWHIVNEHNLRALFDLLQGGVSPTLSEYRINPDFTVDVGADLFEDRTDLVFAASDLEVLDPPDITQNATNRATHILVIGATRRKANGDSFTIFAEAEVPWPEPVLDAFGNPARRVRRVEDSTINHRLYAEAYATYLAEREAATPKACRLRLSDTRAKGDGRTIKAGELIYVHEPASGLEDPTNTQIAADGSVIFPERIRVMSVSTSYGPGYRAVLRQPGGSETNLAGAQWDTDTSIVLELGAFRPDLVINDGTGSTWPRFLRLRGSQPR
jgi:hypothetical protein